LAENPPIRYNQPSEVSPVPATQFKLSVGAKRQVTIPRECMALLSLEEGSDLLLDVSSDHAILTPMVSVPRSALPEGFVEKSLARLGQKPTDIPVDEFRSFLKTQMNAEQTLADSLATPSAE